MDFVKKIIGDGFAQIRKLWKLIVSLYLPILLFFALLGMISRASDDITLSYFTRDVTALGHLPFFAGLTSQLGGMLWSITLGVCIFTAILLHSRQNINGRRFLLQAAILTGLLLLDDIFLVHEDIAPDYLHIGERTIVISYFVIVLFFLFANRNEILSSDFLILGLAFGMFALSIFFDAVDRDDLERVGIFLGEQMQTFLEDGFKFVGIATWLVYFARYSLHALSKDQT